MNSENKKIWRNLFRDLVLILIADVVLIWISALMRDNSIREDISREYISLSTLDAVNTYSRFANPIEASLKLISEWGTEGLLPVKDMKQLGIKFIPFLNQLPHINAIILADSAGSEYYIGRSQDGWLMRLTDISRKPQKTLWSEWSSKRIPVRVWESPQPFDPLLRPWFRGAIDSVKSDSVYWSQPYIFSTDQIPGITASLAWHNGDQSASTQVLAFDVTLSEIINIGSNIRITANSKTFLFNHKGELFSSRNQHGAVSDSIFSNLFILPEQIDDPVIRNVLLLWQEDKDQLEGPVNLNVEDKSWWAGFGRLNNEKYAIYLGILIPETDIWGTIENKQQVMIASTSVILLLGSGLMMLVIFKYRRRLRSRSRISGQEGISTLIAQGEGPELEFKSTMRMNLKSGQHGKEIELAWLKTMAAFMNTDGGTLLIGVADDGSIVGIEPDGFANDDKCRLHFKNLVNQHIGAEYSRYLNMEIIPVGENKVVVLEARQSLKPVFLKVKQDEEVFYIRSGPSSEKLQPSQILRYLEDRKEK